MEINSKSDFQYILPIGNILHRNRIMNIIELLAIIVFIVFTPVKFDLFTQLYFSLFLYWVFQPLILRYFVGEFNIPITKTKSDLKKEGRSTMAIFSTLIIIIKGTIAIYVLFNPSIIILVIRDTIFLILCLLIYLAMRNSLGNEMMRYKNYDLLVVIFQFIVLYTSVLISDRNSTNFNIFNFPVIIIFLFLIGYFSHLEDNSLKLMKIREEEYVYLDKNSRSVISRFPSELFETQQKTDNIIIMVVLLIIYLFFWFMTYLFNPETNTFTIVLSSILPILPIIILIGLILYNSLKARLIIFKNLQQYTNSLKKFEKANIGLIKILDEENDETQ